MAEWKTFDTTYLPQNDYVEDYLRKHNVKREEKRRRMSEEDRIAFANTGSSAGRTAIESLSLLLSHSLLSVREAVVYRVVAVLL